MRFPFQLPVGRWVRMRRPYLAIVFLSAENGRAGIPSAADVNSPAYTVS